MGRYKRSLEKDVLFRVESRLENYPMEKRQLEEYKRDLIPSPTPAYSLSAGGHSGESRPTEKTTAKIFSDPYLRQTQWYVTAIESVISKLDQTNLRLVDAVYWSRAYSVEGAALALHMSKSTAYRRIDAILVSIAIATGEINAF